MNYTAQDIKKAKELKAKGYNWVVRDSDQEIFAYKEKPTKGVCVWYCNPISLEGDYISVYYFTPITWEDTKPTSLDEIIAVENLQDNSDTIDDSKDAIIYSLTAQCEEYKRRAETAEAVISDLRTKLAKAEHDRKRYKAKIEELRKEIRK